MCPCTPYEPCVNTRRSPSLTALLAEDEEELSGTLLHAHVHVCHEAHQLVPDGVADLRPHLCLFQRGKHLGRHRGAGSVTLLTAKCMVPSA